MPELPDVEVFRRTIDRSALDREISAVVVDDTRVLDAVSGPELERQLTASRLTGTHRHGKQLYVTRDHGPTLALHFGMTAYIAPLAADDPVPQHVRMTLCLEDGRRLVFADQRRFGSIGLADDVAADIERRRLGPDALEVERSELGEVLRDRRGGLVSALMDQSVVAGLGNIYSDEVLFQARLGPRVRADELGGTDLDRLHRQLRRVLERAIEADARPEDMPRGWLIHAREDGAPCPRCGGRIRRYNAGGRHAFWCPACQG